MCNRKRRCEDFEPNHAVLERSRELKGHGIGIPFGRQFLRNTPGDLEEIRSGPAAWVEHDHIGVG